MCFCLGLVESGSERSSRIRSGRLRQEDRTGTVCLAAGAGRTEFDRRPSGANRQPVPESDGTGPRTPAETVWNVQGLRPGPRSCRIGSVDQKQGQYPHQSFKSSNYQFNYQFYYQFINQIINFIIKFINQIINFSIKWSNDQTNYQLNDQIIKQMIKLSNKLSIYQSNYQFFN